MAHRTQFNPYTHAPTRLGMVDRARRMLRAAMARGACPKCGEPLARSGDQLDCPACDALAAARSTLSMTVA